MQDVVFCRSGRGAAFWDSWIGGRALVLSQPIGIAKLAQSGEHADDECGEGMPTRVGWFMRCPKGIHISVKCGKDACGS